MALTGGYDDVISLRLWPVEQARWRHDDLCAMTEILAKC